MGAQVVSLPGGQALGDVIDRIMVQNGVTGGKVVCKDVRTIHLDDQMDAAIFEVILP